MKYNANLAVGIINVEGGPDRVTIVLDLGTGVTLSTKFARYVASRLIEAADYIDENKEEKIDDL